MNKKFILHILILLVVFGGIMACKQHYFRANYQDANSLMHKTGELRTKPFLKAHFKNGDICILKDTWKVDTIVDIVSGHGNKYDFNRRKLFEGNLSFPIDCVAIFETNIKLKDTESRRITALAIMAGVDVLVGLLCLTSPKACFGSCPTFYINENDNFHYADAEAFTNAISPSMEYYDIDALGRHRLINQSFEITMKNEALETHCVNDVKILAYPLENGERVYQSPANRFYLCKNHYSLSYAEAEEGDITALLKENDRNERFSLADDNNLKRKEEIHLTFDNVNATDSLGLILNFRQTLMTTYLFYSAMGYMGDNVGDVFSVLEKDKYMRDNFDATTKELGGIDCYVFNEKTKEWEFQNVINETGPIAINRQIMPLYNVSESHALRIKLVINKGLWRLDYVALTNISKQIKPQEYSPICIENKGQPDPFALAKIWTPDQYLISMPGSKYNFHFALPQSNKEHEIFLYSKGYYLEWMREHWIKDKDFVKLKKMVYEPDKYLQEEAIHYKRYENTMEQEFWNSKIDTKTFSYYEN